jgi:hypothetical protein
MKPDSARTKGSVLPGAVTLMTGDLPRGWIFFSSGGALEDFDVVVDIAFFEEPDEALSSGFVEPDRYDWILLLSL